MNAQKPTLLSRKIMFGVFALTIQFATAQLGPNLVGNGSFENPISDNRWGTKPSTWYANETIPGGWTVIRANVEIKRAGVTDIGAGTAYDGFQYIDLNGFGNAQSGIYQNLTVSSGGLYRLQFAMSANTGLWNNISPHLPRQMLVRLSQGSTDIYNGTFTWKLADHPSHTGLGHGRNVSYQVHTIDIPIATSGTYRLSFESLYWSDGGGYGPLLDDVRFQVVPEPASLIALGSGLTGLLLRNRRRAS